MKYIFTLLLFSLVLEAYAKKILIASYSNESNANKAFTSIQNSLEKNRRIQTLYKHGIHLKNVSLGNTIL